MQRLTHAAARLALAALLGVLLVVPLAGTGRAVAAPTTQATSGLPTSPIPDPHQAGVLWFAATGHTLRGEFRAYWEKYGGLAQFGYPITEEFAESGGPMDHLPLTVQYFERARFELHPENAGTGSAVLLGLLGVAFHAPDPAVPPLPNMEAEYFKETGHNLSGPFQAYWHTHGGLYVNGFPISEAFKEVNPIDGKTYLVQYFQRARYEYHPENQPPYDVLLGLLGTQMARKMGYYGPPAGTYPRLGHAADGSWIAGQVNITRIQGGCVFINYDGNNMVQPIGAGWAAAQQAGLETQGAYVVVFGHMAGPGEPVPMCPAKSFVVDKAMLNPSP